MVAVIVKLTARDAGPQFVVPTRNITLAKDRPTVRVGRASKQESKGFVAAEENAWFDSPVMSREHAELTADFDQKTVLIEDTGSLHGTFRRSEHEDKEDRICTREKVSLRDGDIIRFGTDIYRGQQTFPPCTVHVELSWNQENLPSAIPNRATPTNTFSVPDYDDEDLISDDDILETDKPLPSQMKQPQPDLPIDLTGSPLPKQQSPSKNFTSTTTVGNLDSDVIDLTSEPEARDPQFGRPSPAASLRASSPMSIHSYSESSALDYLSDEESRHRSYPNPSTPDESYAPEGALFAQSPLYETDSEAGEAPGSPDVSNTFLAPMDDDDTTSDLERTDVTSGSSDENSDSDDDSLAGESEHDVNFCDEHDEEDECDEDSLHNARCWEEDMSSGSEDSEDEDDPMDSSLFDRSNSPNVAVQSSSSPIMPNAAPYSYDISSAIPPTAPLIHVRPMAQTGDTPSKRFMYRPDTLLTDNRHLSPSGAMLTKPSLTKTESHQFSSTTQALGERTGKYEFFAARDHNRASVMSNPLIQANPPTATASKAADDAASNSTSPATRAPDATKGPPLWVTLPPWREPDSARDSMADIVLETRHGPKQPPVLTSAWTPVGEAFLKEPHNYSLPLSDERTRLQSPEVDMTSASTFVESKKKPENDATRSRRRLAVKFLISQESKEASPILGSGSDNSPRPPKRSYDEVFPEVEDESYNVRSSPAPASPGFLQSDIVLGAGPAAQTVGASKKGEAEAEAVVSDNADPVLSGRTISAAAEVAAASPVVPPVPAQRDVRPAKRRRFSKFAKYASVSVVSGVTSAALLFAGLAATAPQIV
ncbi:Factor arrest protein 10 [Seiridium cupressi]